MPQPTQPQSAFASKSGRSAASSDNKQSPTMESVNVQQPTGLDRIINKYQTQERIPTPDDTDQDSTATAASLTTTNTVY
jgi:hypothetical protein